MAAAAAPSLLGALGQGGASTPSVGSFGGGGSSGPKLTNTARQESDATSSSRGMLSTGEGQRGGFSMVFSPHGSGEVNAPVSKSWGTWALVGAAALLAILIFKRAS